jgi:hypothetical protein
MYFNFGMNFGMIVQRIRAVEKTFSKSRISMVEQIS